MEYSITSLTQVADCDTLIAWTAQQQSDLLYEKMGDERTATRYAGTALELDTELQATLLEIESQQTIIDSLPPSPKRTEAIREKVRLEYRKFTLEIRRENYNPVKLLEREVALNLVIQEIEEMDVFLRAVQDRRGVLVNQA